jgi:hypothetical protein
MLGIIIVFILIGCLAVTATLKVLELFFKLIYRILLLGQTIDTAIGKHHNEPTTISTKELVCFARRLGHYYGYLVLVKTKTYKRLGFITLNS